MKQILLHLAFILPISSFGSSVTNITSIAVYKIKSETISGEFAEVLSDHIESTLLGLPYYRVISRSNFDVLLTEDNLQESGLLQNKQRSLNSETRSSIDKVCTGSVSRAGSNYSFTLKIIDVESGRIDASTQMLYNGPPDSLIALSDTLVRRICSQPQLQHAIDTTTIAVIPPAAPEESETAVLSAINPAIVVTDTLFTPTDTILPRPAAQPTVSSSRDSHAEAVPLVKRTPSKLGRRISLGAAIIFGTLAVLLVISRN